MDAHELESTIQVIVRGLQDGSFSIAQYGPTLVFQSNMTNESWLVAQEVHDQLFLRGILQPGGWIH